MLFNRFYSALHEPIRIERLPALVVFEGIRHLDEKKDCFKTKAPKLFCLLFKVVQAQPVIAGHRGDFLLYPTALYHKKGDQEIIGAQGGLPNQVPKGRVQA